MSETLQTPDSPQTGKNSTRNMLIFFLGLLALLYIINRPGPPLEGWQADYGTALAQAKDSGRNLLVAFHSDYCPPCIGMERNVLRSPRVTDALQAYVPVRVDPGREPELAQRFTVMATPTYAVIDSHGQLLGKTEGYLEPDQFVAFLQAASTG